MTHWQLADSIVVYCQPANVQTVPYGGAGRLCYMLICNTKSYLIIYLTLFIYLSQYLGISKFVTNILLQILVHLFSKGGRLI